MSSALCRRNSMTLLSLFDLDAYIAVSVPIQTELVSTSASVDENRKIKLQVKTTLSKTLLEHLPNELLIYIFEFLSPYDLHRGVYNLNLRLNKVCYSQKLHLDLTWLKHAFDYYCSNQQPFSSQVYSLRLDDSCDRLRLINLHINIDLFTNLRVLTIREPSSENFDKILSKLHKLSHLSHLNIYSALIQTSTITDAIFKIRSLKRLILYSIDPIILRFDDIPIYPLTELEYFEVNSCCTMEFLELLKYLGPNVKRMKIRILFQRNQNLTSIDPMMIDQLLFNYSIPVLLRRLEMKFSFLLLTNFHLILRLFPHLEHLTFSTLTDDMDFISPSIWHQFISTNLLELKQLHFYIKIFGLLGNVVQYPSTELIDSFYSFNSKWLVGPVVMDYNALLIPPLLEFYTYSQSVSVSKCSLELYGKKRYMITTDTNDAINIDSNITDLQVTLTDNQQLATTIDQRPVDENSGVYPKVTRIAIHSQMTRVSAENDKNISLIIYDIIKSIPDLSKIISVNFTTHSSIHSTYPSTTLARRLLDKMPKIKVLSLPYDYLLCLLKSPLIVNILARKIGCLNIQFDTDPPMLPDMIRILKIFSIHLHHLYFNIRNDLPVKNFYFILPSLFSGTCKKLHKFQLRLWTGSRQQPQILDEQFKLRLQRCLTAHVEKSKTRFGRMEYRIKDNEFSILF